MIFSSLCQVLGHKWKLTESFMQKNGGMTEIYVCTRCGKTRKEEDLG